MIVPNVFSVFRAAFLHQKHLKHARHWYEKLWQDLAKTWSKAIYTRNLYKKKKKKRYTLKLTEIVLYCLEQNKPMKREIEMIKKLKASGYFLRFCKNLWNVLAGV